MWRARIVTILCYKITITLEGVSQMAVGVELKKIHMWGSGYDFRQSYHARARVHVNASSPIIAVELLSGRITAGGLEYELGQVSSLLVMQFISDAIYNKKENDQIYDYLAFFIDYNMMIKTNAEIGVLDELCMLMLRQAVGWIYKWFKSFKSFPNSRFDFVLPYATRW